MNKTVLLNKNCIYRCNNFIYVGKFKDKPLYMGIDKLSFISYIDNEIEYKNICDRFNFLRKEISSNYKIENVKDKHYKYSMKIIEINNPEFYIVISYLFLSNKKIYGIRFELSPQYGNVDSIYNFVKWLIDCIGKNIVNKLLSKSRITRIDITVDIHGNSFISNYYFSIPKSRKGIRFIHNKDDCKNNYSVGSKRSEFYLLVYEKAKLYEDIKVEDDDIISVKENDIDKRITRLELRIKPKEFFSLLSISNLKNPFNKVDIYSKKYVKSRFRDFLPFLEQEKSLPRAIDCYLDTVNGSSKYWRHKINETMEYCKSKYILDIDWGKWQDITRIIEPFIHPLE